MTSLILALLFVVIVAFSALVGFVRGLNKSVIRMVTLVLAIIATVAVAAPLTNFLAEIIVIDGKTLGETVLEAARAEEMIASILDSAPLMQEAILIAPAFAMAIVIFPVVFILFRFISWIVFLCVQKPLRKLIFREKFPKKGEAKPNKAPFAIRTLKRFAGLGIGAVAGVLVFGMLMAPLFGLISVLPEQSAIDQVLDAFVEQGIIKEEDAALIKGEYAVTDSQILQLYTTLGVTPAGKNYLNSVSKIESDGQTTYLTDELDSLLAVVQTAVEGGLLNALKDPQNQDALYAVLSDREFVDALMQDMFNSKLLRSAVPEVMAIAMESVARTLKVPENKEAVYDNMMDDIADAVQDADVDYEGIEEYEAYEQAMDISYVDSMEDTKPRKARLTKDQYDAEIKKLNNLKNKISSILKKNVSGGDETLVGSIADNIVKDVQKQAKENGTTNVLQGFNANAVKETITSIAQDVIEAGIDAAADFIEKLTDREKFETPVATVETIKEAIRETVKVAVSDDTKTEETASTLAIVVSDFAGAVSTATDESGNIDATKLDFNKVASAVTSLQNSTLKGVGSSVLDIVASSEDLGKNEMISGAIDAVKDGYENGEEVGGAIGSAGALIGLVGAMGSEGEADKEAAVTSIESLINNLNDFTIKLLPDILTDSMLESMGVPAKYTKPTYDVFETLMKELMKCQGSENYDNEVNAILSLYSLATSGVDKFKKEDIKDLAQYAVKSDAIFNTLNSVSESNPFGIDIKSETTRNELKAAIIEGYEDSGRTQRELDVYNAIAKMLGLDAEVELG